MLLIKPNPVSTYEFNIKPVVELYCDIVSYKPVNKPVEEDVHCWIAVSLTSVPTDSKAVIYDKLSIELPPLTPY